MFRSRRRRSASRAAYRAPFWAAVVIVVLIGYLDYSPWVLDADQEMANGSTITTNRHSGVVVVVDYESISGPEADFRGRNWSAAWINMVEQELGATTVATPDSLTNDMIDQARALVLTSSVSKQLPESLRQRLRRQVLDGMTLVLEQPGGALRDAYSANGEAGRERGHEVTMVRGLPAPYAEQLKDLPVATDYIGSTGPRERATTLLAFDGAPVIYTVPIGDGHVTTLEFDLGEQLVSLQQGQPVDGFQVESTSTNSPPRTSSLAHSALAARPPESTDDGSTSPNTKSDAGVNPRESAAGTPEADTGSPSTSEPDENASNRARSKKRPNREIPYADLLERFVVWHVLTQTAPVVGLWPYPTQKEGVVLLLHSDSSLGDNAEWMLAYEIRRGATSTLLTSEDAGLSAAGAAVIRRRGGGVGLMWRPAETPARSLRRVGFLGVEPLAVPETLGDQLSDLTQTLPSGDGVHTVRSISDLWSRHWAAPFRIIDAQNIVYDTSYRPRTPGFSWGTGIPFRPMTEDGMPLAVREIPVTFPGTTARALDVGPILRRSHGGHHQVVTVDLPPKLFAEHPSVVRFERWLAIFDDADRFDHWMTHPASFRTFRKARRDSTLTYTFESAPRIPQTAAEHLQQARRAARTDDETSSEPDERPKPARQEGVMRLSIDAEAERDDLSLVVPERIGAYGFAQARRRMSGGAETADRQLSALESNLSGASIRRIPLDIGTNTVDVYYTETTEH